MSLRGASVLQFLLLLLLSRRIIKLGLEYIFIMEEGKKVNKWNCEILIWVQEWKEAAATQIIYIYMYVCPLET